MRTSGQGPGRAPLWSPTSPGAHLPIPLPTSSYSDARAPPCVAFALPPAPSKFSSSPSRLGVIVWGSSGGGLGGVGARTASGRSRRRRPGPLEVEGGPSLLGQGLPSWTPFLALVSPSSYITGPIVRPHPSSIRRVRRRPSRHSPLAPPPPCAARHDVAFPLLVSGLHPRHLNDGHDHFRGAPWREGAAISPAHPPI